MASDEDFFPHIPLLSSLRLRSAFGFAGQQPGANDALRTFSTTATGIAGIDLGRLQSSALGNNDLKSAQQVALPATVCGAIERAEDVDYYKFTVAAGTDELST